LKEFLSSSGWYVLAGVVLVVVIWIISWVKVCRPNEALIITGKKQTLPDGRELHTTALTSGRAIAWPIIRKVDRLSLALFEVPISVHNGYSKGGIAMNLEAIANVKISSDRLVLNNAIERFLESDQLELRLVAKETLEGHLRGVIADLTPEQVNEDRLKFAESLTRESEEDLNKLGLHLDTLKILHVSDEVGYLDALGRKAIANIIRGAEIAESDANRAAEQAESENEGRANVKRAQADAEIAKMRNELRQIRAELEARVQSEEERTTAAAREARAKAEQELQGIRTKLEGIRLNVDKVLPADANRRAEEYNARGEAAEIRERGQAVAQALDLLYGAWKEAGPSALQISLIEDLEAILDAAVRGVKKVDIQGLSIIDGGDGRTLSNYIGAYPAMLSEVFKAVDETVGIDIPGVLSGSKAKKEAAN
ncbi:MAG: flotillin family protein, partial [Armatimonadetes bacterium]|nr:flotillin family protein [Armatimonadota bacterium]